MQDFEKEYDSYRPFKFHSLQHTSLLFTVHVSFSHLGQSLLGRVNHLFTFLISLLERTILLIANLYN